MSKLVTLPYCPLQRFLIGICWPFFVLLLTTHIAYGQVNEKLEKAHLGKIAELYEAGQYEAVKNYYNYQVRKDEDSIGSAAQINILKYLASAYYEKVIDQRDSGDHIIKNRIIKLNKECNDITLANDPALFIENYKRLFTYPKLSWGIGTGISRYFFHVQETYAIIDPDNASNGETVDYGNYRHDFSFHFAAFAEMALTDKWGAAIEFNYLEQNYHREIKSFRESFINYTEKIQSIRLPVMLTRTFAGKKTCKKLITSVYLGGYYTKVLKAKADINATSRIVGNRDNLRFTTKNHGPNTIGIKNENIGGALAGVKLNYRISEFSLFADIRYSIDFTPSIDNGQRFSSDILVNDFYYVDDDFRLSQLSLTLGIKGFSRL